jgi:hypothetical protein
MVTIESSGVLPISGVAQASIPKSELDAIMGKEGLTLADKRRLYLERLGAVRPKQKYATKEERKKAAKERAQKRREAKRALLPPELRPQPRMKMTPEEKKVKRSEKNKEKRAFLREMARDNPAIAKKFGIDPANFRL